MNAKQIASIRKIYTDKNCAFCSWMKLAVSWWCSNESAIKARKTSIPGVCHCPYWKPDKDYIIEHVINNKNEIMICKKCGTKMEMERDKVYTSLPPQYGFKCPNCGNFGYSTTPEYDDVVSDEIADFNKECDRENLDNAAAERAKPGAVTIVECQEAMRRLGEAMKGLGCQKRLIEEKQPESSDDVLTEEKVYDYYQERSTTAGDRADQLAWMFVVMMTGGLISGHAFQAFSVCASLAAVYMLLSVAQAVWQTFTSWLFKNRLKKMDVVPDDYPEWVGGGAWLFFWAKMITITSAVIYFVKAIFF